LKTTLTNMIQHGFKSEKDARQFARRERREDQVSIIHSPHQANNNGDYFVDSTGCPFIRSWETELYCGLGRNA